MIELKEIYDPPYNLWYGVKYKNLLRFKITYGGSLPNASALPAKALMPGVMFHMENDGSNYMWNGVAWDKLDSNPFVGATSSADGIQGLVPQPKKADREKFLYGGGGWKTLDASDVKTGVFDLARIPAAALERLVTVADQTERYALTTATVQNGDTVLQSDTHVMYRVVDQTELDNADGYVEYQAIPALNLDHNLEIREDVSMPVLGYIWKYIHTKIYVYTESQYDAWVAGNGATEYGTIVYNSENTNFGNYDNIPVDKFYLDFTNASGSAYAVKVVSISNGTFTGMTYEPNLITSNFISPCPIKFSDIGPEGLHLYNSVGTEISNYFVGLSSDDNGPYMCLLAYYDAILISTVRVNDQIAESFISLDEICNYCSSSSSSSSPSSPSPIS